MKRLVAVFFLFLMECTLGQEYYGKMVGSFPATSAHKVAGSVYAVDKKTLLIKNFVYDGKGPDAFFWIGGMSSAPDSTGIILPFTSNVYAILTAYAGDDLLLTLPNGHEVNELTWLSVWCRQFAANFGHVTFPSDFMAPEPIMVGSIAGSAHGFKTGDITILDTKRIKIENIHYDGQGPDAYFLVGKGTVTTTSTKVPDENGLLTPVKAYKGQTIILTLPGELTVRDINYLSLYCIRFRQNFGQISLTGSYTNVPPFITPPVTNFPNCEAMSDIFNVAWRINGELIEFEFCGALDGRDGYMAFGVSGNDTSSKMLNADPMVVYLDNGDPKIQDYSISAYSLCSNNDGVCPDDRKTNGSNDLTLISAFVNDGVTKVKFSRPFKTSDRYDRPISNNTETAIVWALGNVNSQNMVTKHKQVLSVDKKINFGRTPSRNCREIQGVKQAPVTPWTIPRILGNTTNVFNAKIGPTGGKRGYEGITNQTSWGIAWYINGYLIPELVLRRGENFTFKVEGGNDPTNSARYHPLYITDDNKGGFKDKSATERNKVELYAGTITNATGLYGTDGRYCEYKTTTNQDYATFSEFNNTLRLECDEGSAGMFTWTVPYNAPNVVYYQCFTHNYLGWKIRIVDDYSEVNGAQSKLATSGNLVALVLMALFSTNLLLF